MNSSYEIYGKLLGLREEWRTYVIANHNILQDLIGNDGGSLTGSTTYYPLYSKAVKGP